MKSLSPVPVALSWRTLLASLVLRLALPRVLPLLLGRLDFVDLLLVLVFLLLVLVLALALVLVLVLVLLTWISSIFFLYLYFSKAVSVECGMQKNFPANRPSRW